jgi:glycosyltransferase involved in cell wall biosynthesis
MHESKTILRAKYGIPSDGFVYGYVGRVNADKGINELITAFVDLQKTHEDIYLVLIGMIDKTNPISRVNMELAKNSSHIILTGNVPPSEVYAHMAMFDVLTHPTYREGFGKVLQEAMGVRLPIITTIVPGPSEVVEDGVSGVLVRDHDAADLEEKMELLYSNSEMRESLAREGRKRAEKYFDRPIMLQNILEDINRTLGIETE